MLQNQKACETRFFNCWESWSDASTTLLVHSEAVFVVVIYSVDRTYDVLSMVTHCLQLFNTEQIVDFLWNSCRQLLLFLLITVTCCCCHRLLLLLVCVTSCCCLGRCCRQSLITVVTCSGFHRKLLSPIAAVRRWSLSLIAATNAVISCFVTAVSTVVVFGSGRCCYHLSLRSLGSPVAAFIGHCHQLLLLLCVVFKLRN